MAKRTRLHFSLCFEGDFSRLPDVTRYVDLTRYEILPYLDPGAWDRLKRAGLDSIKRWADRQIERADAVVVLIGAQTYARPLIRYEVMRAARLERGILGVNLDSGGKASGPNPLDYISDDVFQRRQAKYRIYDWQDQVTAGPVLDVWITEALRTRCA